LPREVTKKTLIETHTCLNISAKSLFVGIEKRV